MDGESPAGKREQAVAAARFVAGKVFGGLVAGKEVR